MRHCVDYVRGAAILDEIWLRVGTCYALFQSVCRGTFYLDPPEHLRHVTLRSNWSVDSAIATSSHFK